jgi:hypothetical protein
MKKEALVVDIARPFVINDEALLNAITERNLRCASVNKRSEKFAALPLSNWWATNDPSVSFTDIEVQTVSDQSVSSLLNLLSSGEDDYRIV